MTVYSKTVSTKQLSLFSYNRFPNSRNRFEAKTRAGQNKVQALNYSRLSRWNLVLVGLALGLFLVYIFSANYLVSQKYSLDVLKNRLNQTSLALDAQKAEIETGYSLESLISLSQKLGLVEAKNPETIFDDFGLALSQAGR